MLIKNLLIHEGIHSAAYLILVVLMILILKSEKLPVKELVIGWVFTLGLDLDHLIDYFIYKEGIRLNIIEFLTHDYLLSNGKVYLFLHAWEWVLVLLVAYMAKKSKPKIILFLALSIIAQLIVDTLSYGFDWRVYFISFRFINNFDHALFFPVTT